MMSHYEQSLEGHAYSSPEHLDPGDVDDYGRCVHADDASTCRFGCSEQASREPFRSWWRWEIALYRGDEMIDTRTIKEIAERRGVRKDRIRWYLTGAGYRRACKRKNQTKAIRAVRI
jgi:hypothetical protein